MTRRMGINAALAGAAVIAGGLAALTGGASPRESGSLDIATVTREIREGRDVLSALELARWIRDARDGVRIIDLRSAEAFEAFHIPGATHMTLADVMRADWVDGETVVLYGDDGVREGQTWLLLRALGVQDVYFLRHGVQDWTRTIASPTLPARPTVEEAAQWKEVSEMSRWFGGVPRVQDTTIATPDSLRSAIGRIRRRGC